MPIASSMLIEPQDVNCQLFIQEQDALMNIGLPVQLPDDFYAKQNAIPKIVDCNTGKRYQLMELSGETGNYNFNLGEEVRVRVRNTSAKALHFTLMYQDQMNRYHSLFPLFTMNIRSIPTSFKTLYPGQESVVAIPSEKLPHMNDFLAQASCFNSNSTSSVSYLNNNNNNNTAASTAAAAAASYAAAASAAATLAAAAATQKGNVPYYNNNNNNNASGYKGDANSAYAYAASAVAANASQSAAKANANVAAKAANANANAAIVNNSAAKREVATTFGNCSSNNSMQQLAQLANYSCGYQSLANIRLVLIVTACQTFNEVLNELKHISSSTTNNGIMNSRQDDRSREDKKLLLFNYKFDVKYRPVLV